MNSFTNYTNTTQQTINGFITPSTHTTNAHTFSASPKQIKYYNDLCTQKGQQPVDVQGKSSQDVSELIGALLGMRNVIQQAMTTKQRETIVGIVERNDGLINLSENHPQWESYDKESASKLIGQLFELERSLRDVKPITEAQVSKILRMYLCPDVIFSDIGWQDKYEMYDGRRMVVIPNSEDVKAWLLANVKQKVASDFIQKYNSAYLNWSRSRLTKEQEAHIRTLEGRCANILSPGKMVQQSVDSSGNVVDIAQQSSKEWNVQAHQPLTDLQLYMFSKDDASRYIEELNRTLQDKELIKFPSEPMHGDALEAKRTNDELGMRIKNMEHFIYGCFAELGEAVTVEEEQLITDNITSDVIEQIRQIIAKMISLKVSFNRIDWLLDLVPDVKQELYAQ